MRTKEETQIWRKGKRYYTFDKINRLIEAEERNGITNDSLHIKIRFSMVMILSLSLLNVRARSLFCGFFHTFKHTYGRFMQIDCLSYRTTNFADTFIITTTNREHNKLIYEPPHSLFFSLRFVTLVRTTVFDSIITEKRYSLNAVTFN